MQRSVWSRSHQELSWLEGNAFLHVPSSSLSWKAVFIIIVIIVVVNITIIIISIEAMLPAARVSAGSCHGLPAAACGKPSQNTCL